MKHRRNDCHFTGGCPVCNPYFYGLYVTPGGNFIPFGEIARRAIHIPSVFLPLKNKRRK